MSYVVGPHIHSAAVDGEGVILDLATDRYWGLTDISAQIWAAIERKMPQERLVESVTRKWGIESRVARDLVDRQVFLWEENGFIARDRLERSLPSEQFPQPRRKRKAGFALDSCASERPPLSLSRAALVVCLNVSCRALLRYGGLPLTLRVIQRIRVMDQPKQETNAIVPVVLRAYRTVRKSFAEGSADCLYRTLGLAAALRCLGVDAEICFGVSKFPFWAHTWVQLGDTVLNESLDDISDYEVIAQF